MALSYTQPIYRPPSEADSLLIQATVSCARRRCTFCFESLSRSFSFRNLADIQEDLRHANEYYHDQVTKIFLLSADPLAMKTASLVAIAKHSYLLFPRLKRIAMYAHAKTILAKTERELAELVEAGITLLYVGIESGNNAVLERTKKGVRAEEAVTACQKALKAGFRISTMIIFGLGGTELFREHSIDTARTISAISPHFVGALNLMLIPGTELAALAEQGLFTTQKAEGILEEMRLFLETVEIRGRSCVFRTNHPSNFIQIGGNLPADKSMLLRQISVAQDDSQSLRYDMFRVI